MDTMVNVKITKDMINEIKARLLAACDISDMPDEELRDTIDSIVRAYAHENTFSGCEELSLREQSGLSERVFDSIRGLGILDSIMKDDSITEVMINGFDHIFVERNGCIERIADTFESEEQLEDTIQKIVGREGREVNRSSPIVDTRLADGSRVNVVLPPIALSGPTMTIRKFSKTPMSVEELIRKGSITGDIAKVLRLLVTARYNIFVCGGTGSGKTTFLNALSDFIPKDERIITIEDSAELKITGVSNLVSLESRNANAAGKGRIEIRDLIRSSLRMRPDRIIVGEVRGKEALDMLQAMNTGHDGSLSTGHANSCEDMFSRLETMVLEGAEGLPLEAIRRQISSSIDIMIHLSRLRDHSRKTMEISEVLGIKDGKIELNPIYVFEEDEYSTKEKVSGCLKRTTNEFKNYTKLHQAGIDAII